MSTALQVETVYSSGSSQMREIGLIRDALLEGEEAPPTVLEAESVSELRMEVVKAGELYALVEGELGASQPLVRYSSGLSCETKRIVLG